MGITFNQLFLLAFIPFCLLACSDVESVESSKEHSDFLRFMEEEPSVARLESAIVSYKNEAGCRVDLIAVLHLADPAYYDRLELFFRAYDAVLYELIKPENMDWSDREEDFNLLSNLQRNLCHAMNLEYQLDAIDYSRPNFVHADLTTTQFMKRWEERGESVWKLMWQSIVAQARAMEEGISFETTPEALIEAVRSPDSAAQLKLILAREFQNIENLLACFDMADENGESLILGERNRAAIDALEKQMQLGDKNLAIFYGAGHMPDLEIRLKRDLDFVKTGQEWFTAWEIRLKQ